MAIQKYYVTKDRSEIYKDFTINLLHYIYDFYIDNKTLSSDNDITNHFNFCFNKVVKEFEREEIYFGDNEEIRKYFYDFYYSQIYKNEKIKTRFDIKVNDLDGFWRGIFEINIKSNKNLIQTLIGLYLLFDKSIEIQKKIIEKI